MSGRNIVELFSLAALWGASFLFMRMGADDFGPIALIFLRVGIAGVCLLPLLWWQKDFPSLWQHRWHIAAVGVLNSAVPFSLFAFATLYLTAGFTSIINASAPLWGALVAWLWLKEPLTGSRIVGLLVGFAGVVILIGGRLADALEGVVVAAGAAVIAAIFYGIAASYTKRYLTGVSPMAIATGSQLGAALALLPLAVLYWPVVDVPIQAWWAVSVMAIACTALAYVLYFRLIAQVGPAKAISVTFLIPVFAVIWGAIFLQEKVTITMLMGCGVILLGTALATGLLALPKNKV